MQSAVGSTYKQVNLRVAASIPEAHAQTTNLGLGNPSVTVLGIALTGVDVAKKDLEHTSSKSNGLPMQVQMPNLGRKNSDFGVGIGVSSGKSYANIVQRRLMRVFFQSLGLFTRSLGM